MKQINEVIQYLYTLSVLVHREHVNTKSFARHEALGKFYDIVSEVKDRTVEYCIGEGVIDKVKLTNIAADADPMEVAKFCAEKFCKVANEMKDDCLINIAGEFEESVGRLRFFYQLR